MKRRARVRGFLICVGTTSTFLMSIIVALNLVWGFGVVHRGWSVGFGGGVFSLAHVHAWANVDWLPNVNRQQFFPGWFMWLPQAQPFYGPGGGWMVDVPLWIPIVAVGVPTGFVWWRGRRRFGPGCCAKCGYDLTGNTSGRCPECGAAVERVM